MPKISEAVHAFLHSRQTPANADLVARWSSEMETQLNVAVGEGEPVAGKRTTWSDGINEWFNIRIPKNAATDPTWNDYELRFPLTLHAEGIGMTGWRWTAKRSCWCGFDFDAITTHAKGIGIDDEQLEKVKHAACALPYVEVRKSTGGSGVHLYVYFAGDGIPTDNHTEHAALARCILGMMSSDTSFDFASQIDACGHIMWIWHRKMAPENQGLTILKPAATHLAITDLPHNWRDHIEVVKRRRNKVRVNQIAEEEEDPFEALTASRKIVPLDDSHKAQIEALMRSGFTTLWIADHHLLQTHTKALEKLLNGPEGKELKLIGLFTTNSQGKDPGTPNCFLFPLKNGMWRVYRFSQGVTEADNWTQDGQGWTTCGFNRYPDLKAACTQCGGVEKQEGGYVFSSISDAIKAAQSLGQELNIDPNLVNDDRKITLKSHKDGRLIVEIERMKNDGALPGWDGRKSKYIKIFSVTTNTNQDEDLGATEYDKIVRCLVTPANQDIGWRARHKNKWVHHPAPQIKKMIQNLGHSGTEADEIMGGAGWQSWWLVTLPFQDEYPGGRQWNIDAAQFRFKPAELADDEPPHHPHWDLILDHIGLELTPALRNLPWAVENNVRTGTDYLRRWIACAFRAPFQPLPYLFLHGPEDSGKSIFHEALKRLVTKGIVKADRALGGKDGFNGEIENAVICAIEELDLSKCAGARERLKAWVTGETIPIRKMRQDSFEQPNMTHWVQTANYRHHCPIFPGDTRITAIYVPDLLREQMIGKEKLLGLLEEEAPHFMHTLMSLELPHVNDRLRLPVISTDSKTVAEEINQTDLEAFIAECCTVTPGQHNAPYNEFYDRFQQWLPANEKHSWTKRRLRSELPIRHPVIVGTGNRRFISDLTLKPGDKHE